MKRFALLFLSTLFISYNVFAQSFSGELITNLPVKTDFSNQTVSEDVLLNFDYKIFETDMGVRFNGNQFQFSTSGLVFPKIIKHIAVGGGIRYHFINQSNIFYENDMLISVGGRFIPCDTFSITLIYSLLLKFSDIVSIRETTPCLFSCNSGLEILMNFKIYNNLNGFVNITSFDYFDYPLLGIPFIRTGIEYNFYKRFTAVTDCAIKLEDMFTSTTYVSACIFRIGVNVDLW